MVKMLGSGIITLTIFSHSHCWPHRDCTNQISASQLYWYSQIFVLIKYVDHNWGKISKVFVTDGPKSPENYFNQVSRLWTSQKYLENMFIVLKSKEILFDALLFMQKLLQLQTFLKFFPICVWKLVNQNITWYRLQ